ncbi:MAG: agmatine deiminase family protein [Deltaproteobacteria bacterium]|nr:agmatine deiminase family protein [Deltaproteobacteria bacterium]
MKRIGFAVMASLLTVGCSGEEGAVNERAGTAPQAVVTPAVMLPAAIAQRPHLATVSQLAKQHVPSSLFEKHLNPRMLPKWKTSWERDLEAGKGMSWFGPDPRSLHPEDYAITQAPAADVRVIAEHEQSQAVVYGWPPMGDAGIDKTFIDTVVGSYGVVPVILAYTDSAHRSWYHQVLTAAGLDMTDATKITFWQTPLDSVWTRDYGPVAVQSTSTSPKVAFVDFRYYTGRALDDQVPTALAEEWGINVYRPNMDFEGGNFTNTSDGLCMATLGALWFNTQIGQSAVEDIFEQYLGCKKSLFLTPLEGEGTTHIDMLTRLASDTTMLIGEYYDSSKICYSSGACETSSELSCNSNPKCTWNSLYRSCEIAVSCRGLTKSSCLQESFQCAWDGNQLVLDANAALVGSTTTPNGTAMKVVRIPMPDPGNAWGERIWRTYTNSLILKGASKKVVLIPVYADEDSQETKAMQAYTTAFGAGWDLVKIESAAIIPYGGAMHCISMQIGMGQRSKIEADPAALCGATSRTCRVVTPCGNVNTVGCCDGSKVSFCDKGTLIDYECGVYGCGWTTSTDGSYYDCGGDGEDPTGDYPLQCGGLPDGGITVPDAGTPIPCGDVAYEGCCDGDVVRWCDNGVVEEKICADGTCGWDALLGAYNCNTNGAAEPSNTYPQACTTSVRLDAGTPSDVGTIPGDAGTIPGDAGTDITADSMPMVNDASASLDSNDPKADGGTVPTSDSSTTRGDVSSKEASSGCAVAPVPSAPPFVLLALLGLAFVRRRG